MIVRPAKNAQLAPSIWVKALERLIITIANKLKLPVFLTKKGQTISHFQRRKLNMWPGLKFFDNWINYITNHWESNDLYFKLYKPKFKDDLLTICLPQGRHPNLWQLFVQVFFQSEKKINRMGWAYTQFKTLGIRTVCSVEFNKFLFLHMTYIF